MELFTYLLYFEGEFNFISKLLIFMISLNNNYLRPTWIIKLIDITDGRMTKS